MYVSESMYVCMYACVYVRMYACVCCVCVCKNSRVWMKESTRNERHLPSVVGWGVGMRLCDCASSIAAIIMAKHEKSSMHDMT